MTPLEHKVAHDLHQGIKEAFDELERIKAERDELANTLKRILNGNFDHLLLASRIERMRDLARAALAKLEAK